ncbi:MAG: hypothetical protein CVT64_09600 [Actinobacteria bacterium HGW-Actinobacteria-4]|nr:MAG: hypothetical protein CVT64_09600 [Actinobacteria bacterium HGW-Actinobacteria-4]
MKTTPVAIACALAAILTMSACAGSPDTVLSLGPSASTSPTPTTTAVAPSPTTTPPVAISPTPDAGEGTPEGPIAPKPVGTPVEPEIFLATIDYAARDLQVVVFVPDIFESGGTCRTTVTVGGTTHSLENKGESDATGTACGQFRFALNNLASGKATIVAYYQSTTHVGESAATEVDIP